MSLVAIVNLADRLLNQTFGQDQETQSKSAPAKEARVEEKDGRNEDRFTRSVQATQAGPTAEAAGLFQVTQFTVFSAAADFLLTQTAAPPANQVEPAAPYPAAVKPAVVPTPATNTAVAAPVAAGTATNSAALKVPAPASFAPATTPAATTTNLNTQEQLQALNNALAALGLPQADFAKIDRIASLIKDFNPVAFTDLVYQLAALAKAQSAQPAASGTNTANATTGAANNGAPNGGGLHIQELVIRFSSVEAQGTIGGAGNGTNGSNAIGNFQISAFNLQIQEVNLTLANNSGQTTKVQAPVAAATPSTAKAATA